MCVYVKCRFMLYIHKHQHTNDTHTPPKQQQVTFQGADGTTTQLDPTPASGATSLFPTLNDDDEGVSGGVDAMVAAAAELVDAKTGERVLDVRPGKRRLLMGLVYVWLRMVFDWTDPSALQKNKANHHSNKTTNKHTNDTGETYQLRLQSFKPNKALTVKLVPADAIATTTVGALRTGQNGAQTWEWAVPKTITPGACAGKWMGGCVCICVCETTDTIDAYHPSNPPPPNTKPNTNSTTPKPLSKTLKNRGLLPRGVRPGERQGAAVRGPGRRPALRLHAGVPGPGVVRDVKGGN